LARPQSAACALIALECAATELATPIVPRQEVEDALSAYRRARDATNEREWRKALAAIDNLIHDLIIHNCGNSRLIEVMNGLRDQVARRICSSRRERKAAQPLTET
jgi:DNA-binding GntR family transcriptional regulator